MLSPAVNIGVSLIRLSTLLCINLVAALIYLLCIAAFLIVWDLLYRAVFCVETDSLWLAFAIFNFITAVLYYCFSFDGTGTASPAWTSIYRIVIQELGSKTSISRFQQSQRIDVPICRAVTNFVDLEAALSSEEKYVQLFENRPCLYYQERL